MTTSRIKKIKARTIITIAFYVFVSLNTLLVGQGKAHIHTRFSNPQFDHPTRTYFLDVELSTTGKNQFLFGMNLRFFYDASVLEFLYLDKLHEGYAITGKNPRSYPGNHQSGTQMFNLPGTTSYVNGAIQLQDIELPLEILQNQWVRVLRLAFKVPLTVQDEESFCPAVIWDQLSGAEASGYLPGSEGLIITVLESNPSTPAATAPTVLSGALFNWKRDVEEGMPYGNPASTDCISIGEVVSTEDPDLAEDGYALFQNKPNPFDDETTIEFILPFAQQASIKFFDVSGKFLDEMKGSFKEGRNTVTISLEPWMIESKVILYRLETEDYKSRMRKMTLISK